MPDGINQCFFVIRSIVGVVKNHMEHHTEPCDFLVSSSVTTADHSRSQVPVQLPMLRLKPQQSCRRDQSIWDSQQRLLRRFKVLQFGWEAHSRHFSNGSEFKTLFRSVSSSCEFFPFKLWCDAARRSTALLLYWQGQACGFAMLSATFVHRVDQWQGFVSWRTVVNCSDVLSTRFMLSMGETRQESDLQRVERKEMGSSDFVIFVFVVFSHESAAVGQARRHFSLLGTGHQLLELELRSGSSSGIWDHLAAKGRGEERGELLGSVDQGRRSAHWTRKMFWKYYEIYYEILYLFSLFFTRKPTLKVNLGKADRSCHQFWKLWDSALTIFIAFYWKPRESCQGWASFPVRVKL